MKLASDFRRKGIMIALLSGLLYGFYTAFMTLGMSKGVWVDWYGVNKAGLSAFAITYLLSALGAATNDSLSAIWAFGTAAVRGRAGDFFRCLKTKPGMVMVLAALIGGPFASTCYVLGLQKAGSIVVPISALCPAFGAILGRFMFKQELNARMMLGIAICFGASLMIGSTSLGGDAPEGMAVGIFFGFLAAIGWGFEGCVCGYGTSMIDSEVGITIRQVTSGLSNLIILIPIFGMMDGQGIAMNLVTTAFTDSSIIWFAVSGLCAYLSFMFWYKGNSMCGAALGMSCNGTFSFWGPFCCWIVLGVVFGIDGWAIPPIAWAAAVVMIIGIFTIALNPLDLLKKKEQN
ncbi:MAG: hypothetical protein MI747_09945 [Desulfobacterales bacterium]|nr:hypothetical protein [Desulfobacterales bacterium]